MRIVRYNALVRAHPYISGNIVYLFLAPGTEFIDGPESPHQRTLFSYRETRNAKNYFSLIGEVSPGHSIYLCEPNKEPEMLFDGLTNRERVFLYLFTDEATQEELDYAVPEFLGGDLNRNLREQISEGRTSLVVISRRIEQR